MAAYALTDQRSVEVTVSLGEGAAGEKRLSKILERCRQLGYQSVSDYLTNLLEAETRKPAKRARSNGKK